MTGPNQWPARKLRRALFKRPKGQDIRIITECSGFTLKICGFEALGLGGFILCVCVFRPSHWALSLSKNE